MSKVRFLIMDVDGTLTDGKIYMGETGELAKAFDIKDGCGISLILPQYGIIPVIITARKSSIVANRCKELKIEELYQGVSNKLVKLEDILAKHDADWNSVAYVGDDLPDIPCMRKIKELGGLVLCPQDAIPEIRMISDYVSEMKAGEGAIRDCIEYLVDRGDHSDDISDRISKVLDWLSSGYIPRADSKSFPEWLSYSVQEYTTKDRSECVMESHRNHIDIQYIVSGHEEIDLCYVGSYGIHSNYDSGRDCDTWDSGIVTSTCTLAPGSIITIYNGQVHRGCIVHKESEKVCKIVCKIECDCSCSLYNNKETENE